MSLTYLIAFEKGKRLQKTDYLYKYILPSKKTVFREDDGILFDEKLWPQECDIAQNLFNGREVYGIRSEVYLEFESKYDNLQNYLLCAKEQIVWFKSFIKKHLTENNDILFFPVWLGHPINYSKIPTKKVPIDTLDVSGDSFYFDDCIYWFVLK